jgi:hypothetical protein
MYLLQSAVIQQLVKWDRWLFIKINSGWYLPLSTLKRKDGGGAFSLSAWWQ